MTILKTQRIALLGAAILLLEGCAATPLTPLTAGSPASPKAAEGGPLPRQTSLRADAVTQQTRAQLSAAQKEQEHWDDYGPVSGTLEEEPKTETQPEKHTHDHR